MTDVTVPASQATNVNDSPTAEMPTTSQQLENIKGSMDFLESAKARAQEIVNAMNQARGTADADATAVSAGKKNFEDLKSETEAAAKELKSTQAGLQKKILTISNKYSELEPLVESLQDIQTNTANARKSVEDDIAAINEAHENLEKIRSEISDKEVFLKEQQKILEEKIAAISADYEKISSISNDLLKDKTKETKNVDPNTQQVKTTVTIVEKSMKAQIFDLLDEVNEEYSNVKEVCEKSKNDILAFKEDSKTELSAVKQEISRDFSNLKVELENRILALLPNASAAGLSHGYVEAKGRYVSKWATFAYYMMFIAPLVLSSGIFLFLHEQVFDEKTLLLRFLIISPLLAISSFGLLSIRMNRRLYEEYNYKQRVMQLYDGFEKVISDEEGFEDQKKELVNIMLEAVKDKPSLAMSKYDKGDGHIFSGLTSILKRSKGGGE